MIPHLPNHPQGKETTTSRICLTKELPGHLKNETKSTGVTTLKSLKICLRKFQIHKAVGHSRNKCKILSPCLLHKEHKEHMEHK